jgi:hypothetical protein
MFNKIKEFFTGSKPAVEATTQEVTLTAADVAIRNIKETTEAVVAKVEVAPAKEPAWTNKHAPPIAKSTKPKQQSVKTAVPAAKKRPPAPK